jgi:hypothetical protein
MFVLSTGFELAEMPMSSMRYLCLLVFSGVQHLLRCVFVLFFFVLCTLYFLFLGIVHFSALDHSATSAILYIYYCFRLV